MYVFSEEKLEILKIRNGENQEQSIFPWCMGQTGGLNIICFNKLSWVYDVILTTFMLVSNTYL